MGGGGHDPLEFLSSTDSANFVARVPMFSCCTLESEVALVWYSRPYPHNTTPLILRWLYVVTWVGATLTVNVAPTELWPLAHRWSYRCGNVVAT